MAIDPAMLTLITTVAVAPIASALAKVAEKAPISYQGKHPAGILLALSLASFGVRVGIAWAGGDLTHVDWNEGATLIVQAVTAALVAAGGYALAKKQMTTP